MEKPKKKTCGRKVIHHTEEEKKEAMRESSRRYYQRNRDKMNEESLRRYHEMRKIYHMWLDGDLVEKTIEEYPNCTSSRTGEIDCRYIKTKTKIIKSK